jgi:hypothetical protein
MDSLPDDNRGRRLASDAATAGSEPARAGVGASRFTLIDAGGTVLSGAERDEIETRVRGKTFFCLDVHQPTGRRRMP